MSEEKDFYQAIELFDQQRYNETIDATENLIQRNSTPNHLADIYYLQARALAACNKIDAAKNAILHSIESGFHAIQHIKQEARLAKLFSPEEWETHLKNVRSNLKGLHNIQVKSWSPPVYAEHGKNDSEIIFNWQPSNKIYYQQLFTHTPLNNQYANCESAIMAVGQFVNQLWQHHPASTPTIGTSLQILMEAFQGASFRCTEYALLFCDLMTAVGFYGRTVQLLTKTIESPSLGQSHTVAEVYDAKEKQWIMVDVQWGLTAKKLGKVPEHP